MFAGANFKANRSVSLGHIGSPRQYGSPTVSLEVRVERDTFSCLFLSFYWLMFFLRCARTASCFTLFSSSVCFALASILLLDSSMYSIASWEVKCHVGTFLAGFLLDTAFGLSGICIKSDTLTPLLGALHSIIDLSIHARHGN